MRRNGYSIFTAIGPVIVVTVATVMAVSGVLGYLLFKATISEHLRERTDTVAVAIARSAAPYIQAYSPNDYAGIIDHEMEGPDFAAIVLRDFVMAELTGLPEFATGRIRDPAGRIEHYDPNKPAHRASTAACFHSRTVAVGSDTGRQIGEVTVCASDQALRRELARTIRETALNLVLVSLILMAVLFVTIYRIVIAPVTAMARSVARGDALGVPLAPVPVSGPREITVLAAGINGMIEVITGSIAKIEQSRVELERNQAALALAERGLREIIWGTNAGTWEWNVETGEARFNDRWAAILGYTLDELGSLGIETWYRFAHPEDLPRSRAALESCFAKEREFYECEIRMRHRDGSWAWVLDRGKVVEWAEDGRRPLRMSGTRVDITERKRAELEREKIKDDLMRSNEDLSQFSYAISHDLQAPLRNVASFMQLLQRGYASQLPPEANEYIDFAVGGAKRMSDMIHSLLEFSRVGSQGRTFEPVDLGDALRAALDTLSLPIADTGATIAIGPLPQVTGDRMQLERLFQNLVGNALKYQRPGTVPRISVSARQTEHGWEIAVSDNGIGIPPDQAGQLFRVFKRLHTEAQYEGTGVGLAVCKRIVARHGGLIWVESEGTDRGSRFVFTLPAAA